MADYKALMLNSDGVLNDQLLEVGSFGLLKVHRDELSLIVKTGGGLLSNWYFCTIMRRNDRVFANSMYWDSMDEAVVAVVETLKNGQGERRCVKPAYNKIMSLQYLCAVIVKKTCSQPVRYPLVPMPIEELLNSHHGLF